MRRQLLVSLMLCVIAWLGRPQAACAVEGISSSDPRDRTLDLAPADAGPLKLAKFYYQHVEVNFRQIAMVSPDGRSVMYLQGGSDYSAERKKLYVAQIDARDSWSSYTLNSRAIGRDWLPRTR
ncbi:hypothetical protein [Bradyrhizobium septentrionale]